MLALIHENPFQSYDYIQWDDNSKRYTLLPSRATLIVSPPNLINQWYDECVKLYGEGTKKVYFIRNVLDYDKLTWNHVLLGDIIIMSYSFLTNVNYRKRIDSMIDSDPSIYMQRLILQGRASFGKQKWYVTISGLHNLYLNYNCRYIHGIHWHRVVFDELHELESKSVKCQDLVSSIHGSWYWGLTGTPKRSSWSEVVEMAKWLSCFDLKREAGPEFAAKCIRRNEPNLALPPITEQVIHVNLTTAERALFMSMSSSLSDMKNLLQMCSHHQISDLAASMSVDSAAPMKAEEVSRIVQSSRLEKIGQLEVSVERKVKTIGNLEKRRERLSIDAGLDELEDLEKSIQYEKDRLKEIHADLRKVSSEYAFFKVGNPCRFDKGFI
jgi:SNF2 family DNA or RNA helicase